MGDNNNNSSGSGTGDWLDRILGWYDWYDRRRDADRPPEFHQVPMSPEQRRLYEIYMKNLSYDSPTRQAMYPYLTDQINQFSGGRWQSPGMISGIGDLEQGYSAYQRAGVTGGAGGTVGGLPGLTTPQQPGNREGAYRGPTPSTGHDGRLPFMMQQDAPNRYGDPDAPEWGETIGDWLTRNPGGDPRAYLPNYGQGTEGPPDGMEYGDGTAIRWLLSKGWDVVTALGAEAIADLIPGVSKEQVQSWIDRGEEAFYNWISGLAGGGQGSGGNP